MIELSEKIKTYISNHFGERNLNRFIEYLHSMPPQYIRVNSHKISTDNLAKILFNKYKIETEELPGIPYALKIKKDSGLIGKTVEHILGYYYIQGLSSMLPPVVLNPLPGDIVLDLCAAPGSKTTQLAGLMNNKGTLVANEIQLSRVKALVHNIERMNVVNTGVLHKKGELLSKIYSNYFYKILVDAPCSGLGIIHKKDEVINWWNENKVHALCELQTKLLVSAVKMCKAGGEIVYSTCTLTKEENEEVVNKIISKYPVEAVEISLPLISHQALKEENSEEDILKGKRIFPWEADTDGFFIIKLKKTAQTESSEIKIEKRRDVKLLDYDNSKVKKILSPVQTYFGIDDKVLNNYKFIISPKGDNVFFTSENWNDHNSEIFERIGLKFGSMDKYGELVMHTHAAQILGDNAKDKIIVLADNNELKTYLEGGIIRNDSYENGQYIIKYNDYILGTAVVTSGGIKSRFPRSKRTQEIFISI